MQPTLNERGFISWWMTWRALLTGPFAGFQGASNGGMANLTDYLLKVANLRTVDRHLRYPGKLRTPTPDGALCHLGERGVAQLVAEAAAPLRPGPHLAVFQGTSNGGRQFLRNGQSNRHLVPLYGKSDSLFTQGRKFAHW